MNETAKEAVLKFAARPTVGWQLRPDADDLKPTGRDSDQKALFAWGIDPSQTFKIMDYINLDVGGREWSSLRVGDTPVVGYRAEVLIDWSTPGEKARVFNVWEFRAGRAVCWYHKRVVIDRGEFSPAGFPLKADRA
jgi:hypothetical protein